MAEHAKDDKGLRIWYSTQQEKFRMQWVKKEPREKSIIITDEYEWYIPLVGGDGLEETGKLDRRGWKRFIKEVTNDDRIDGSKLVEFLEKEMGLAVPEITFEDV